MKKYHLINILLSVVILLILAGCGGDVVSAPVVATPTSVPPVKPDMATIAGGTFNININKGGAIVQQAITVSNFLCEKYEVTNKEFVVFLNDNGNQTEGGTEWFSTVDDQYNGIIKDPNSLRFSVKSGYGNRPVVYVNWYASVAYCNWLSQEEGFTQCYGPKDNRGNPSEWRTKNGYRLTTEYEWEYACRAGSTTDYYWGENYQSPPPPPFNIGTYAWYSDNSNGNHHDAGQKQPNAFGLFDMSGNVWEWCNDFYSDYSSTDPETYTDPAGPSTGSNRVNRGGSWSNFSGSSQSSVRASNDPLERWEGRGFRIVRTP
ncbi:MAG: SUMF1/EgtB/PvdO family nonheme iron enzyme [Candidatus Eremiobacterota bacterium]